MTESRLHHRTCPLCEAMCGVVIEHRGIEIISIKPDREDVLSRGHICPKAVAAGPGLREGP
jgi:predicted molibdopterin-dependent oxidoreductase YjgC